MFSTLSHWRAAIISDLKWAKADSGSNPSAA